MSARAYWHSDYTQPITADELRKAEEGMQKEVMREWFLSHYENPVESTPYESREGGYQYIWGGPYDAEDELFAEFSELVPEHVIKELSDELEEECVEWSGKPSAEEYDDYLLSIITGTEFYETFKISIDNIERLLKTPIESDLEQNFLRLLYINIITALETYLSDAFINTVLSNKELMRRFVETNPDFQKQKISVSEIFSKIDSIEDEIKHYLIDILWHNLEKVKPMYKNTLDIDFPRDLKNLFWAITARHDIVHRNGKSKDGKEIFLSKEDITNLIREVRTFVNCVDSQFCKNK